MSICVCIDEEALILSVQGARLRFGVSYRGPLYMSTSLDLSIYVRARERKIVGEETLVLCVQSARLRFKRCTYVCIHI